MTTDQSPLPSETRRPPPAVCPLREAFVRDGRSKRLLQSVPARRPPGNANPSASDRRLAGRDRRLLRSSGEPQHPDPGGTDSWPCRRWRAGSQPRPATAIVPGASSASFVNPHRTQSSPDEQISLAAKQEAAISAGKSTRPRKLMCVAAIIASPFSAPDVLACKAVTLFSLSPCGYS